MDYKVAIATSAEVSIEYSIPEHLQSATTVEEMRERDKVKLDEELQLQGWNIDKKIAAKQIWRMGFPGMILDIREIVVDANTAVMRAVPIHPHRADLAYKSDATLSRNVVPLTANAVVTDADRNVVAGVRGGNVEAGKIAVIPGGHAECMENFYGRNVAIALFNEFGEELGRYAPHEFDISPTSMFNNEDTNGINVLFHLNIKKSFEEIEARWKQAKDRAEHQELRKLTIAETLSLVNNGAVVIDGKQYETTPFFRRCFAHFIDYHTDIPDAHSGLGSWRINLDGF